MALNRCVVCGSEAREPVMAVARVPIHPFRPPPALGLAPGFGSLEIVACAGCGHLYNAAFDPGGLDDLYAATVLTNTPVSDSMIQSLEATAAYILSMAPADPIVADIGGGTGVLSRTIARKAREVHLVEPSRALDPRDFEGSGVTLHQASFPAATLGDRHFDVIVSRQVVEHIPEPMPFLQAVRSRLKDDGIAYIEVPSAEYIEQTRSIVDFHYPHVHYYRRPELEALFARAGLEPVDVTDIKTGHDRGFLLRASRERPAPAPPRQVLGTLARDLAARVRQGQNRLCAYRGTVALYGSNAYSQALLGLYPDEARYSVMFDDTPMYEGQHAYGPGIDIPIRRPATEALDGVTAVVITSYLHDVVIGRKIRDLGFRGPLVSVRADSSAGTADHPHSLFDGESAARGSPRD